MWNGRISRHLPKAFTSANIIGVDTDREAIELAREILTGVIFRHRQAAADACRGSLKLI